MTSEARTLPRSLGLWSAIAVIIGTTIGFDKWLGTISPGMQADLVVLAGNPVTRQSDIRNVETVFKRGIGYDAAKLRESVKGLVGLR